MIKQLILEEVYGNIIVAYHRTKVEDIINKVYDTGWQPKDGDMYGKGFYGTFTLEAQLRDGMIGYGPVIGKFRIDINNFVIFEWDIFQKTKLKQYPKANENNFIELQLIKYDIIKNNNELNSIIDQTSTPITYSSDIAVKFFNKATKNLLNVDGIIFRGRQDGDVIVAYNTNVIHPLSVSYNNGKNFITMSEINKEYHTSRFMKKGIDPKKDYNSNFNLNSSSLFIKPLKYIINHLNSKGLSQSEISSYIKTYVPKWHAELIDKNPDVISDFTVNDWESLYMNWPRYVYKYPSGLDIISSEVLGKLYLLLPDLYEKYKSGVKRLNTYELYRLLIFNSKAMEDISDDELYKYVNKFGSYQIIDLIVKYPDRFKILKYGLINGSDWANLFIKRPDLIKKYRNQVDRFRSDDWIKLFSKLPEYIDKLPEGLEYIEDVRAWDRLLFSNPSLIDRFPDKKTFLSPEKWYRIYQTNPDVIDKHPEGLDKVRHFHLITLLKQYPYLLERYPKYFKPATK